MQSTSVHILPVLELGQSSGSSLREPDDAASFDSLLYRSAPQPVGTAGPPEAESHENQREPNDAAADHEPTDDNGAAPVEDAAHCAPQSEANDDQADDDQPDDGEAAQALAAVAAAVPPQVPKDLPVVAGGEAAIQADPIEPTSQSATSPTLAAEGLGISAPKKASAVAPEAATPPEGKDAALHKPEILTSDVSGEQLVGGDGEPKPEEGDAASRLTKEAASEKTALPELHPPQFEQPAENSRDKAGEIAADATSPEKSSDSVRPQLSAMEQSVAANAATEAKPGESGRTMPHNTAIDAVSGAVPRSRLPAAVLVREPAATRGALHIDSARLLNRVARAFTSAQQQGGEIQLRLSPPELGSLRLVVQIEDRALVAHLEAETPAARTALIDNLPVLRERLAEQGVRIHRFDVDLMQRHAGDQPGGLPQRSPEQERYFSPPRTLSRPEPALPSAVVRSRLQHVTPGGLNVIVSSSYTNPTRERGTFFQWSQHSSSPSLTLRVSVNSARKESP